MKKVVFALALIALVIGSVYAGTALAAPSPGGLTGGPSTMQTFTAPPVSTGDLCLGNCALTVFERYFSQLRHISVTVERPTEQGFYWIEVDIDGDGYIDGYQVYPNPEPLTTPGEFFYTYEFNAFGIKVVFEALGANPESPISSRVVNITTTYPRV